nr:hypothetical protein [Tanacetum cinerariifolium]
MRAHNQAIYKNPPLSHPSFTNLPSHPIYLFYQLKKQKKDDEDERLLSIFKQIHINLPFLEAMIHMPKRAKVLKDLLLYKEKLEKAASSVKLSEECSAIIQRSLPQKEGDPGSFTLLFLEMDKDELVLIILGQPFLPTARAVIDIHERKLSLRAISEIVTFNIRKSKQSRDDYLYYIDHTAKLVQEQWVDTVDHDGECTQEEEERNSNEALVVSLYPRTEPIKPLEWKALENRLKPSSVEPPKLELKELPEHLEYTFLQETTNSQWSSHLHSPPP